MDIEIKAWLYDILTAINEIEGFVDGSDAGFTGYQNDLKTRRAVERNVEIIGEAVNRITQRNEPIQLSNARKIIDTRNRIIHGYDSVSDEVIWSIVVSHLPVLKEEAEKCLNE